jgi:hypothetical protein
MLCDLHFISAILMMVLLLTLMSVTMKFPMDLRGFHQTMKLKTSRVRNISIRTGVLDEKAAATQALGLFAQHTTISYAR